MYISSILNYFDRREISHTMLPLAQDIWNAIGAYYTREEKAKKIKAYNDLDNIIKKKIDLLLEDEISKYTWDKIIRTYKEDNSFETIRDIVICDNFVAATYEVFDKNKDYSEMVSYQMVSSTKEEWYDVSKNSFIEINKSNLLSDFHKYNDEKVKFKILYNLMSKINECVFLNSGLQDAVLITSNRESLNHAFYYNVDIKVYLNCNYWRIYESFARNNKFEIDMIIKYGLDKYCSYRLKKIDNDKTFSWSLESITPLMWSFSDSIGNYVKNSDSKLKVKK